MQITIKLPKLVVYSVERNDLYFSSNKPLPPRKWYKYPKQIALF